jgi:hypothetical protein
VVEHLPSKCEALSSIPDYPAPKEKKKKKEEEENQGQRENDGGV